MTHHRPLEKQKVLVTGGSRGIGAAIVKLLASHGAQVAFTYSSQEEQAKSVLSALPGEGHMMLKMDISKQESVDEGLALVLGKFGELTGLVNNAGITKDQLLLRMKTEDFDSVINTNLRGTFFLTKAVIKGMLKSRKGSIVNISSVVSMMGNPGQSNYAASKSGVEGFSRSVALEVASRGLRVNCVAPGFIQTEMTDVLTPEQRENVLKNVPMARMGEAFEIAEAVSFLLGDGSKYITGHTLCVNGGLHL